MISIKSEKGATLVEFVLVLPLLLLFTFAIIEFSVLMYDKAVITLGSREGARAAIVWRPNAAAFLDTTDVKDEIDKFLGVVGTDPPTRLISFGDKNTALQPYDIKWSQVKDGGWSTPFDPIVDEYMKVRIQYRYDFMVLHALGFIGFPDGITLQGETIMRMEDPS